LSAVALLAGVWASLLLSAPARGAEPDPPGLIITCAECGMKAMVANRFVSRLVQGERTLYFCDIGDLAAFLERTHPKEYAATVHDFPSGEWIDAGKALYVVNKNVYATPMGWGVAAFRDRAAVVGVPLDFGALRKALR
jgi:nitrous oxide reductase accessory protein NosL